MKKYRLKKLADQILEFPYGVLFGKNSPFENAIENDDITKTMYGPKLKEKEWRFEYPSDNSEWRLMQSSKKK